MSDKRTTAWGGSTFIDDTTNRTGVNYHCFVAQEDTTFTTISSGVTDLMASSRMNLTGKTLKAGALMIAPIGLPITTFRLATGSVIAYTEKI